MSQSTSQPVSEYSQEVCFDATQQGGEDTLHAEQFSLHRRQVLRKKKAHVNQLSDIISVVVNIIIIIITIVVVVMVRISHLVSSISVIVIHIVVNTKH